MITVYADVLVGLNIITTYIFLVCSRAFTRCATNKWGVAIASVAGGLSSLIILAENLNIFISVIYKIGFSMLIVYLSFFPDRIKKFMKVYFTFIGVSALFGGLIFFFEFTFLHNRILYLNGTVYFDISIKVLLASIFIIYGIFMFLNYFMERRVNKKDLYTIVLTFRNISLNLQGCVDNCNNLTDVLTGRSVLVGELKALSPFFSYEELYYLKKQEIVAVPDSLNKIIRFIPCKTVTEDSLIPVFTPGRVEIMIDGKSKILRNVCIGIVNKSFSDGEYNLLLNKNILE